MSHLSDRMVADDDASRLSLLKIGKRLGEGKQDKTMSYLFFVHVYEYHKTKYRNHQA